MTKRNYDKEKAAQYYLENKEHIKERNKKWRSQNKDKMREYAANYKRGDNPTYLAYADRHFQRGLWISVKHNATKAGLPFNLDETDIVIPERCPYLDIPLTKVYGQGHLDTNASVDKIIPELGYVKGNIQVISRKANRMKNNASIQELLTFSENIQKLHKTSSSVDIDALSWAGASWQRSLELSEQDYLMWSKNG